MSARGIVPGPICGRSMNGGADHCGMPRLHRGRCAPETLPDACALCGYPRATCRHEGCYALGFDRHQDVVRVTTVDYLGTETATRCRRCGAGFGMTLAPHASSLARQYEAARRRNARIPDSFSLAPRGDA